MIPPARPTSACRSAVPQPGRSDPVGHRPRAGRERRVVDLTRSLSLAQSTISGHLACLGDCQLVTSRAVGRQSFYRLTQPDLIGVLGAAEQLLTATGCAVALCPTYGTDASAAATGTSA